MKVFVFFFANKCLFIITLRIELFHTDLLFVFEIKYDIHLYSQTEYRNNNYLECNITYLLKKKTFKKKKIITYRVGKRNPV